MVSGWMCTSASISSTNGAWRRGCRRCARGRAVVRLQPVHADARPLRAASRPCRRCSPRPRRMTCAAGQPAAASDSSVAAAVEVVVSDDGDVDVGREGGRRGSHGDQTAAKNQRRPRPGRQVRNLPFSRIRPNGRRRAPRRAGARATRRTRCRSRDVAQRAPRVLARHAPRQRDVAPSSSERACRMSRARTSSSRMAAARSAAVSKRPAAWPCACRSSRLPVGAREERLRRRGLRHATGGTVRRRLVRQEARGVRHPRPRRKQRRAECVGLDEMDGLAHRTQRTLHHRQARVAGRHEADEAGSRRRSTACDRRVRLHVEHAASVERLELGPRGKRRPPGGSSAPPSSMVGRSAAASSRRAGIANTVAVMP